ncbi:hypothetical protein AXF42_Ash006898 [Apostasia shenzhenica]|uniref:Uncharacterized protein n=1 Tax=Apostasia shenzhenica TaxID=1088818 RepID=A0A2I0BEH5_9ASPA|nr:hypothetical protein AXF42_Ash006898 [Apostasia shenzhenica]
MNIGDPYVEDNIVIAEEAFGQLEASYLADMSRSDNLVVDIGKHREVNGCIANLVNSDGKILAEKAEYSSDSLVELGMIDSTEISNAHILLASLESKAIGEFSSIGIQYSKDMLGVKESFEHERYEAHLVVSILLKGPLYLSF